MDFPELLQILRRRGLVILLCLAAGVGGGYYAGHSGAKQYSASTQCIVNLPAASTLADEQAAAQVTSDLVATYARVVSSRSVARQVASSLHLHGGGRGISGHLSAATEVGDDIIDITAKSTTAGGAAALANAASHALIKTVGNLQSQVKAPVTIKIVDPAVPPTAPISPKPHLDLILGLILGLLAGIGLAALLESMDRTVRSSAALTAIYEAPVLATVPRRRRSAGSSTKLPVAEPYRILRSALRYLDIGMPLKTILVTSPSENDGKTQTAANLAGALAAAGETVIVVDADLRKGSLAEVFAVNASVGLTSVLLGSSSLDEALREVAPGIRVLASGPLPPNPSELLGTDRFGEILDELAASADKVIIDSPPVVPVADAVTLAGRVDGVIVVMRQGKTTRRAGTEAARRLVVAKARILGYVLNAVSQEEGRSSYHQYRGDRTAEPALPPPTKAAAAPRRRPRRTTGTSA